MKCEPDIFTTRSPSGFSEGHPYARWIIFMKKHLIFTGLVFCVLFLAVGCATHLDQAGQFRSKHKEESRDYVGLHPVSPEAIDAITDIQYGQIVGIIAGACPERGNNQEVDKLADNLLKIEAHSNAYWKKMSQELKTAATNGGQVYQYEFDNGSHQRGGFLVLKNGDIVKKMEFY